MNTNGNSSPEGISLKEYINERLFSLEKTIDTRFESVGMTTSAVLASADKATLKAEMASEKRFESINEFRQTLSDQAKNFLTRTEFDAKWEGMEKNRKDNTSLIMSVLGIVISVVAILSRFVVK